MASKSILVAYADPQAFEGITQALGEGWELTSVSSEADALARLEQRPYDAVLIDFNLGDPDASQLLDQALEKRPETVRFLSAYEADLALVAAKVHGAHELLPKPVEPNSLKSRIESALAPEDSKHGQTAGNSGSDRSAAPVVPAVYSEVLKALESPGATNSQVAKLIGGDEALRSEVLRLANSSYLKLRREIADPVEAVDWLGLDAVKAIVMALRFLAEHSHLKPGYLSLDALWQHSVNVAQLARDLVLFETKDRALGEQALVAGLMHDLGKVVLATNFDDLYARVHSLARKQPVALWEVEKEMFGASHGEIGGCLVGMWNLPASVVEATAFHHDPPLGEHQHFTPLAAVHISNVLEHQRQSSDEFRVGPVISPAFLNELGLLERLPFWRAALASSRAATASPKVEGAKEHQSRVIPPEPSPAGSPRTGNQLLAPPTTKTQTATSGHPNGERSRLVAFASRRRLWVYAGALAAIVVLLIVRFPTDPELRIRGLTPDPSGSSARVVASRPPVSEPAIAAVPDSHPATAIPEASTPAVAISDDPPAAPSRWEESPEPDATLVPKATPSLPESTPIVESLPHITETHAPQPVPSQTTVAQPEFRLSGIIYSVPRPIGIVNGKTVCVGDSIDGATVLSIGRTDVTLKINGQLKICALSQTKTSSRK